MMALLQHGTLVAKFNFILQTVRNFDFSSLISVSFGHNSFQLSFGYRYRRSLRKRLFQDSASSRSILSRRNHRSFYRFSLRRWFIVSSFYRLFIHFQYRNDFPNENNYRLAFEALGEQLTVDALTVNDIQNFTAFIAVGTNKTSGSYQIKTYNYSNDFSYSFTN